jgi:hypothetical protein
MLVEMAATCLAWLWMSTSEAGRRREVRPKESRLIADKPVGLCALVRLRHFDTHNSWTSHGDSRVHWMFSVVTTMTELN